MKKSEWLDSVFFGDLDEFSGSEWGDTFLQDFNLKEELSITATVSSECFYNDNKFGIYIAEVETAKRDKEKLKVHSHKRFITVKGVFETPLKTGLTYFMKGKVDVYNNEKQLFVQQSFSNRPTTGRGILAYLKTLKGLDKRAEDIFRVFGEDSINVLINNPKEVVKKVRGVGNITVERCKEQLLVFEESQIATVTLLDWGLREEDAIALVKNYGDEIIFKIESNPYCLMKTKPSINFKSCDKIAFELGFDMTRQERIEEGLIYSFETLFQMGHTCFPYLKNNEIIKDDGGFLSHAKKELAISLNYRTMVNLFENRKSEYIVGEKTYPIDLKELENSINKYNAARYYKDKDNSLYCIVDIDIEQILSNIETLINERRLVLYDDKITTMKHFSYENNIANKILSVDEYKEKYSQETIELLNIILDKYLIDNDIILEEEQDLAIREIIHYSGGFFVLNGAAGCGKTFILRIVLDVLDRFNEIIKTRFDIGVYAPTGKASKVVEEATGRESMTVHRGLSYQQGEFNYNEYNTLPVDYVILDESSMLDVELGNHLLLAIDKKSKVVFVGDIQQLPSVGPGSVLKDLILSKKVTITTLKVPKRQTEASGIYDNANRVIAGEMIETSEKTKDFYLLNRTSDESILVGLTETIDRLIKKGEILEETQVLTPQRGTLLGVDYLNYHLQKVFNPLKEGQIEVFKTTIEINGEKIKIHFRVGDKVIHIKNNYEKVLYKSFNGTLSMSSIGITNGETGVISDIEEVTRFEGNSLIKETRITVLYGKEYAIYTSGQKSSEFSEIELAYALTIHKSQGSGWNNILIPISNTHQFMWDKNLLYTAITRGRHLVALFGSKSMAYSAVKSDKSQNRYTNLLSLLNQ